MLLRWDQNCIMQTEMLGLREEAMSEGAGCIEWTGTAGSGVEC